MTVSTRTVTFCSINAATKGKSNEAIELDPLNSNPCMITLIKVIEEMHKKFGTSYTPDNIPKWMLELYNKCKNPSTHLNVKLFIIKLILNVKPEIFEPYARYLHLLLFMLINQAYGSPSSYPPFVRTRPENVVSITSYATSALPS